MSLALLLLAAVVPLTLRQTAVRCLHAFGDARIGVLNELAAMAAFFCVCATFAAVGTISWQVEVIAASVVAANCVGLAHCIGHLAGCHAISPRHWIVPGTESVPVLALLLVSIALVRLRFLSRTSRLINKHRK